MEPETSGARSRLAPPLLLLLELTKFRIAWLSALSAVTGYLVFTRTFRWGLVTSTFGILLLALGACALNEWQDREIDGRMERTRRRPLPSGRMRPAAAVSVSAIFLAAGTLVLWLAHGWVPALLGLVAVAWYNGVYTYLKRVSPFAVVPGSLIGAIPPAIGWAAAGGHALDPHILALCFFLFVWQVPHFWLLLFVFGLDYEQAGLPSLTRIFTQSQLGRLTFLWIVVTACSSLLLRIYGLMTSPYVSLGLVAAGIGLVVIAARLIRGEGDRTSFRMAFRGINVYALVVMGLLVVDALAMR